MNKMKVYVVMEITQESGEIISIHYNEKNADKVRNSKEEEMKSHSVYHYFIEEWEVQP